MCKPLTILLGLLSLAAASLPAQIAQADRVTVQPELTVSVRLAGHLPRWANPAADAGPVAADTNLHLTFVLSRAPQQQSAFTQLLADQQDPASPRYHQWLTPQQVGELYGPTQHDIDALAAWLTSRGLAPSELSPSRIFLTVSGPVSAVSAALSTSFHSFTLNGEPRLSTTQEPALPAALASIVQSIAGLSDTPILPMGHGQAVSASASVAEPRYTNGANHYVTPGDFANIFDLNTPYLAGITGVGQKVAIIGRSRVVSTDITEFETNTGLAANLPNTIVPGAGPDPSLSGNGDESEATMDVQRVLGTAPSAQADLVILPNSGGGIFTAAQYEVNTLNDPVMNISFGQCEASAGSASVKSWDSLFSQAASQGISVLVCSMDSGAATCDTGFATAPATQQLSINSLCSSSYATCVGGTEFADTANPSLYWSSSNSTSRVSALGYIPEGAWNEPGSAGSYVVAAGGGGASLYIAKPSWQTGTGVPSDGARDVPDISYPSAEHDGYYGCYALGGGDCTNSRFEYFYGTSNAAPAMAAVTALLNQRTGTRQGNLNPTLYRLAATPANGVFHDATVATSGVSGCSVSVPSMCNTSTPSPTALTGGLAGYLLTPGYDLATGWGSIDGNNLLNAAGSPGFASAAAPSTLTLSAGATTGNSATLTYISLSSFAGTITQSCTVIYTGSGTPIHLPTCSFSPSTLTLPAGGSVTGTITIASTAPGGTGGSGLASIGGPTMAGSLRDPANARDSAARTALPAIALGALFLGLLPGRRRRLSLLRSLAMASAIAVAAASLSGCGGGSSPSTSTGSSSPGSTSGSYVITLTSASGTTTATPAASISLTIQ
jgi:subtilase family serine protease